MQRPINNIYSQYTYNTISFFFFLTCFHLDILGLSATPATWTKSEEPMQKPIVTFLTKSHLACFLQVGCPISSNLHCHPMSVISLVQSTLIVLRPIVTQQSRTFHRLIVIGRLFLLSKGKVLTGLLSQRGFVCFVLRV